MHALGEARFCCLLLEVIILLDHSVAIYLSNRLRYGHSCSLVLLTLFIARVLLLVHVTAYLNAVEPLSSVTLILVAKHYGLELRLVTLVHEDDLEHMLPASNGVPQPMLTYGWIPFRLEVM
jgi:hypothetical protein